ncbi:MAG: AbrB/MazE/SpoVT family DNA-binding domain-containing protein [Nitrososphaerota archaeon]|jgi:AbrB family looped-hinge helix DNA binding protein|nr:AbrB/MazE/SpoVT family DNA-binding domain-containing protein [Nitrososphaerota archaeon]MDG6936511.1 AbrB/MazE/SpoVT family DNA-binding domain-containing protein [Nitrososphaerota archaeon]MDG6944986.1 AbrB/MazE/SpoVT family DNA-binding domain-containing protein [Nitrososphaerota archaeon]
MNEVVVTRKGQTTIPKAIRDKYGITVGTKLEVFATENGILFKKRSSTFDLAGTAQVPAEDAIKLLNRIREEE